MKDTTRRFIADLINRHGELAYLEPSIICATEKICALGKFNKLLLCGNGGSAADCEHMAGELNKGFVLKRKIDADLVRRLNDAYPRDAATFSEHLQRGVPCVPLTSFIATNTAYLNDCCPDLLFAQGVNSLGNEDDVLVCFSTSGNSKNVVYAAELAKVKNIAVISFTGETGGKLKQCSDVLLNAPSCVTHLIQEYHLSLYHCICLCVENELFAE